jgi:hypothetical protein
MGVRRFRRKTATLKGLAKPFTAGQGDSGRFGAGKEKGPESSR